MRGSPWLLQLQSPTSLLPLLLWLSLMALSLGGCQRPCDASSCSSGCCASTGECVEGTSRLECGTGGEACKRCSRQERCTAARCEALAVPDAGWEFDAGPNGCQCATSCCLGDGSCAPNNGADACGAPKKFCGRCDSNQRCESGACVPLWCGGCLDPLGACHSGRDEANCGVDGGVCTACATGQLCRRGGCL